MPEIALEEAQKSKFEGKTVKAYGYLRVSGKGQVDGDGLIHQEQAINDYATSHGIGVAGIFREEGSPERRKTASPWPR